MRICETCPHAEVCSLAGCRLPSTVESPQSPVVTEQTTCAAMPPPGNRLTGERLTEVCTRIGSAVLFDSYADFDFEPRPASSAEVAAAKAIETWLRCCDYEIRPGPTNTNRRNLPFRIQAENPSPPIAQEAQPSNSRTCVSAPKADIPGASKESKEEGK